MKASSLFRFTNDCCFMSSVNNRGCEGNQDPRLQDHFLVVVLVAKHRMLGRKELLPDPMQLPCLLIIELLQYPSSFAICPTLINFHFY